MKWRRYGRNAVLVEFAEKPNEWAFHKSRAMVEALTRKPPHQLIEFVPGYTTLLLEFDLENEADLPKLAADAIELLQRGMRERLPSLSPTEIPVRYDGPDLQRVADHNGLSPAQVVKYHSQAIYKVYLLGFSPGFPYLGELHHKLHTPRLEAPRTLVPAGSVGIGGKHTGIYSVDSPGGWNIIGHTGISLFDPFRASPGNEEKAFLLKPGDLVRFIPVS
jgi:inhibitor of KinA